MSEKDAKVSQGYIESYPCNCFAQEGAHICWIVRHPVELPYSYPSRGEAKKALKVLRKRTSNG